MMQPMNIVFLGLSLSSSWGNGHATTFRSLLRGLHRLGHTLTFLERDVSWYADNRDLQEPDFCDLRYYRSVAQLLAEHGESLRKADAVVVGSLPSDVRHFVGMSSAIEVTFLFAVTSYAALPVSAFRLSMFEMTPIGAFTRSKIVPRLTRKPSA